MNGEYFGRNPIISHDQIMAKSTIKNLNYRGYHAECHSMENTGTGETEYYALVMRKEDFDALIAEIGQEKLPWEIMIQQPTFVTGKPSRYLALLEAMQPFMEG